MTEPEHARSLDALFYPQLVCLDETALKYLLLIYDRIFYLPNDTHLSPAADRISSRFSIYDNLLFGAFGTPEEANRGMMYAAQPTGWDENMRRLMSAYDLLEDRGVCVPIQDPAFNSPYKSHPLDAATDSDMEDRQFHYWCDRFRNPRIIIPDRSVGKEFKAPGLMIRPPRYRGDAFFTSLCSERINSCLYFAGAQGLVPVSNHDLFIRLFGIKLKRALGNPATPIRTGAADRRVTARFSVLSWQVLSQIVTHETLAKRTVAELLTYKEKSAAASRRFRQYLFRMEAGLAAEPWDEKLREEIDRLVRADVLPALEQVREEKADIWRDLFGEVIKTAFSKPILKSLAPLLTLHLLPGISYHELILLSTAALTGEVLPKLVDARQSEASVRRNALFFVLKLSGKG